MPAHDNTRWVVGAEGSAGKYLAFDPKVEQFLEEITAVCRKHGMSIAHEDTHGAFVIANYHPQLERWLRDAMDARARKPEDVMES
jgi:hypothetical protein